MKEKARKKADFFCIFIGWDLLVCILFYVSIFLKKTEKAERDNTNISTKRNGITFSRDFYPGEEATRLRIELIICKKKEKAGQVRYGNISAHFEFLVCLVWRGAHRLAKAEWNWALLNQTDFHFQKKSLPKIFAHNDLSPIIFVSGKIDTTKAEGSRWLLSELT